MLEFVLYLLAAISFGLAAAGVAVQRVHLVALGLLFWVLVPLIDAAQSM